MIVKMCFIARARPMHVPSVNVIMPQRINKTLFYSFLAGGSHAHGDVQCVPLPCLPIRETGIIALIQFTTTASTPEEISTLVHMQRIVQVIP